MSNKKEIVLSEEQKDFVRKNWDKMSLMELVRKTFNNDELDGRSLEAKYIKKILGNNAKKLETTKHIKVPPVELTDEHKEFIVKNVGSLRAIEIARILFNNPSVEPLGREVRAVSSFISTINDRPVFEGRKGSDLPDDEEYTPPTQISQVVGKVNLYTQQEIDYKKMSTPMRRCMEALRGFLKSPRFLNMINSYTTKQSRNIFESEFVRGTWDKPDLTADELNLYVNLCSNYVMMITINRQLDKLNEKYDAVMGDTEAKISMTLAEMIKVKTDELNKCDKRQSDLIEALNGKRSARKSAQKSENISIANLIEMWKEEEERKRILEMAELKKKHLKEEVDRLSSMEDIKCKILGFTREDLLNG